MLIFISFKASAMQQANEKIFPLIVNVEKLTRAIPEDMSKNIVAKDQSFNVKVTRSSNKVSLKFQAKVNAETLSSLTFLSPALAIWFENNKLLVALDSPLFKELVHIDIIEGVDLLNRGQRELLFDIAQHLLNKNFSPFPLGIMDMMTFLSFPQGIKQKLETHILPTVKARRVAKRAFKRDGLY